MCEMGAPEGSDKKKECFGAGNCVAGKCECFQGYSGVACADKEARDLGPGRGVLAALGIFLVDIS